MKTPIIATRPEIIEGREVIVKVLAPADSRGEPEVMQTHPTENAWQKQRRWEMGR